MQCMRIQSPDLDCRLTARADGQTSAAAHATARAAGGGVSGRPEKVPGSRSSRSSNTLLGVVVGGVVVRAVWFFDGTLFWHVSFENHTPRVVFKGHMPE